MTTETTTSLRLTRVLHADPETVFRAWTDPAELEQWYCPEGGTVDEVEVDLRVGGRYRVAMRMPSGVFVAYGVYKEIDPPRRLVFTWQWEGEGAKMGETLVTVELHDRGGSTELVFTHEGFPDAEERGKHEHGWTSVFNRLEAHLTN